MGIKYFYSILIIFLEKNEFPAEFDTLKNLWLFKGTEISDNYVSQKE